jgi:hypothetical protein
MLSHNPPFRSSLVSSRLVLALFCLDKRWRCFVLIHAGIVCVKSPVNMLIDLYCRRLVGCRKLCPGQTETSALCEHGAPGLGVTRARSPGDAGSRQSVPRCVAAAGATGASRQACMLWPVGSSRAPPGGVGL